MLTLGKAHKLKAICVTCKLQRIKTPDVTSTGRSVESVTSTLHLIIITNTTRS